MGVAPEAATRGHELVQRAGGCHELGAVRGRNVARVPHQPHIGAAPGQRAARGGRRQRQTVTGPTIGVHLIAGTFPSATKVRVWRGRPQG